MHPAEGLYRRELKWKQRSEKVRTLSDQTIVKNHPSMNGGGGIMIGGITHVFPTGDLTATWSSGDLWDPWL